MEFLIWGIIELLSYLFSAVEWGRREREEPKRVPAPVMAVRTGALSTQMSGPCAFCKKKGGVFLACRACKTPHHADCASLNRRCAVFGCAGREFRGLAA